jgi:hypothetical protein
MTGRPKITIWFRSPRYNPEDRIPTASGEVRTNVLSYSSITGITHVQQSAQRRWSHNLQVAVQLTSPFSLVEGSAGDCFAPTVGFGFTLIDDGSVVWGLDSLGRWWRPT